MRTFQRLHAPRTPTQGDYGPVGTCRRLRRMGYVAGIQLAHNCIQMTCRVCAICLTCTDMALQEYLCIDRLQDDVSPYTKRLEHHVAMHAACQLTHPP